MTKFSERLVRAAKHAGVGETQAEIAVDLGLTRQTVNHWFLKGAPEADNLALIEKRWGVNGEWLRSGDGEMLPQPSPDGLAHDERELVKHYRLAPANVRPVIISMVRAARKAIVTVGVLLPPFLGSAEMGAPILHNTDCMPRLRRLLEMWRRVLTRANTLLRTLYKASDMGESKAYAAGV